MLANNHEIEIGVSSNNDTVTVLLSEIAAKDKLINELEQSAVRSQQSIQKFYAQQKALFDEFVILRGKYDKHKSSLLDILWNHCAQSHPDLNRIPSIEDINHFLETDEKIGKYCIGNVVGEGQFAAVRSCWKPTDEKHEQPNNESYAIKIIQKEKITTMQSLKRISMEIDILWHLRGCRHVIEIHEVIHTKDNLYIVTDLGPPDLFEFSSQHNGISEDWVKVIVAEIIEALAFCHRRGICHRDLKPENILLTFDVTSNSVQSLKLCDFGLATYFDLSSHELLHEFCGSPGFFSPEMILAGGYYSGNSADLWSVGCIMLEMLLGHELFGRVWMTTYDYDILQDPAKFEISITNACQSLTSYLPFSEDLNDFLLNLLMIDSAERLQMRGIYKHSWLQGHLHALADELPPISTYNTVHFSETPLLLVSPRTLNNNNSERKNGIGRDLPLLGKPPKTPNVKNARRLLHDGDDDHFPDIAFQEEI